MGQLRARQAAFRQKWEAGPPEEGSAEATDYEQDRDALATTSAALAAMFAEEENLAEFWKPENAARFQSVALQGAVGLTEPQWQQVDARLEAVYREAVSRGLNADARPAAGLDLWDRQRKEMSEQAFREVSGLLPAEQAARFQELYAPENWLWTLTSGR